MGVKVLIRKNISFIIILGYLIFPSVANAAGDFDSWFCPNHHCSGYDQWIQSVWSFSLKLAVPTSIVMLAIAGVLWITSGGDPQRLKTSKRMIIGVVSGVGLLLLARLFIITLLGPNAWKNGAVL